MHAFSKFFAQFQRAALRRGLGALALCTAVVVACAAKAQQQAAPAASVAPPTTTAQPAPSSGVGILNPRELINAAAQAAGLVDPAAAAPAGQAPAGGPAVVAPPAQRAPRVNPFHTPAAAPAGSADSDVVIPHTSADPEKVVVKENDGLISLLVREGSLRQVIAMIAETQKLNIVFAGPTDTLVTASFEQQKWETVLDALLSASGHTWAVRENVIFVSSMETAGFLPPGAEGRKVQVFELDFASAVDVDQTIKGLLSPAGESWLVETNKADNRRTKEAVAVVDYPAYLARVNDYIGQADQPPRQVYIEAHILQVELKDDCKSGVNFENLISLNSADVTLRSVGLANGAAPSAFFIEPEGAGLNGLIELLKTTTDAKTLASPKIHGVSGQESHIQIGGQLGYRVTTTTQTSTLESVQFLDVGVVLRVTPRITRDGRVLMRIYPKVSTGQVDPETGLPSEETTEVETDVLLCSGQGLVMGGLIQEGDSNIQSKIPLLGEIPYLGLLFQRRQVTRSRQEIIVTLQPHVLPYEPIIQARLEHDYMRSTQPLTQGAIASNPRPYEPAMPDVLSRHKHKPVSVVPSDWPEAGAPGELMELPPVDASWEDIELLQPLELRESGGANVEELPVPSESRANGSKVYKR